MINCDKLYLKVIPLCPSTKSIIERDVRLNQVLNIKELRSDLAGDLMKK